MQHHDIKEVHVTHQHTSLDHLLKQEKGPLSREKKILYDQVINVSAGMIELKFGQDVFDRLTEARARVKKLQEFLDTHRTKLNEIVSERKQLPAGRISEAFMLLSCAAATLYADFILLRSSLCEYLSLDPDGIHGVAFGLIPTLVVLTLDIPYRRLFESPYQALKPTSSFAPMRWLLVFFVVLTIAMTGVIAFARREAMALAMALLDPNNTNQMLNEDLLAGTVLAISLTAMLGNVLAVHFGMREARRCFNRFQYDLKEKIARRKDTSLLEELASAKKQVESCEHEWETVKENAKANAGLSIALLQVEVQQRDEQLRKAQDLSDLVTDTLSGRYLRKTQPIAI